jgi:Protein of unknown function (Gmx_para_CXXCG)
MKLFHFRDPQFYYFAQAIRCGTWHPQGIKICPECNTSRQKRISPLIIEWEPGSDVIGDFVWPGLGSELVISQKVREVFEGKYREIKFEPIEFWQNPRLKRPMNITHRSKPRVWLPYSGPSLWDVIPTSWCHLDLHRSNVSLDRVCSTCGKTIYTRPSSDQRFLIVDTATWNGEDIFRVYEYSSAIYCTEQVKEFIENAGFTNVSFLEDGLIPD